MANEVLMEPASWRRPDVWERMIGALARIRRRLRPALGARRTARARAHFWAEVRAGQREAEDEARPLGIEKVEES